MVRRSRRCGLRSTVYVMYLPYFIAAVDGDTLVLQPKLTLPLVLPASKTVPLLVKAPPKATMDSVCVCALVCCVCVSLSHSYCPVPFAGGHTGGTGRP